jgi:hypothetical protein
LCFASATLQASADQQEAESVKRTVAMEEREVKSMQKEIQVHIVCYPTVHCGVLDE